MRTSGRVRSQDRLKSGLAGPHVPSRALAITPIPEKQEGSRREATSPEMTAQKTAPSVFLLAGASEYLNAKPHGRNLVGIDMDVQ
jgi:hypothetical protein